MYNYKYNFLTLGSAHWRLPDKRCFQLVTDTNIPRKEMWSLIRKTKINIIVNLLFLKPAEINNIKSLDRWNVIEHWFEPDVDFIYYDDEEDLPNKINEILLDWDSYSQIIENAFQKVVNNYTTEKFINRIKGS